MLALSAFFAIWFLAGLVTGLTSFGSNLVAVPLLAFIYPARDCILIGCISACLIFLALALIYRRATVWFETLYLVLGAWLGILPGAWFLKSAGPAALLLAAGFSLCLFLLWQLALLMLKKRKASAGVWLAWPMGIFSGVLMGSVGMGGPPLVLYVYLRNYDKAATISTINAASAGIMLSILPWLFYQQLYTPELVWSGLLGGAAAIAGIFLSIPLLTRINIAFFRSLLLLVLAFSALTLLVRGFASI